MNKAISVSRYEHKSYITYDQFLSLKKILEQVLKYDDHCKGGTPYSILSLYYDTLLNTAYYDKIEGYPERKKFRVRKYGDNGSVKLEIKQKSGEIINKASQRITDADIAPISAYLTKHHTAQRISQMSKVLSPVLLMETVSTTLRPVVWVEYDRLAFTLPFNNVRITFDMNLRSKDAKRTDTLHDVPTLFSNKEPTQIILEVKYNNYLPNHIERILRPFMINKTAISKYCNSRQLVY